MPKGRLYKDTYKLGYNTRDNPQDIPFEACQTLVNCFPGDPNPLPRLGVDQWNTNILPGAVLHQIPWPDATEPKTVLHIGNDLYWQIAGSGAITQFATGVIPTNSKLSWVRLKDQVLVNSNLTGSNHRAFFVAWNGTTFTYRLANIVRPALTLGAAAIAGTAVSDEAWRSYAFTFVNRDDAASVDGGAQPKLCRLQDGNFHPGLLESIDDVDNRLTFQNTSGGTQGNRLTIDRGAATLDTQITHLRIWVTEEASSESIAEGLSHRWLADVPVKGTNAYAHPYVYDDTATVGELAGDLDVIKVVGFDGIQPGTYMLFHQGLVWNGGVGGGESIGRHYYSAAPQDVEYPQKWWTMFQISTQFKDTSFEDAEQAVGIGVSRNDLIFFMKRSLWYLRDGDVTFEPALIGKNKGTSFPKSITQVNEDLYYVSNEGPAMVQGRDASPLQAHTAGEVWPKIHDNSTGYFHGLADKTTVYGFYYREAWWLTDGVKLIGLYLPSMGRSLGPMSVELADDSIGFGIPCVLDPDTTCLLASRTAAGYLWHFLHAGVHADNGSNFMLKSKSKAMYVSQKDRDRCGEAYGLKILSHYEDSATLYVEFISDFFRYNLELDYNQYTTSDPLISEQASVSFRNIMQQPFPEGLVFGFCEIGWRKEHRTPYSFSMKGFIFEYIPREGDAAEFISRSRGDGVVTPLPDYLFYATFDEDSDTLTDRSLFERHHTWANGTGGSRTHDGALVPGGGQGAAGGTGSGWSDADWDGMDHIGDGGGGLNSEDLTYEYVVSFPSLAAAQVIQEGGDGTDYWRLRVNTDGSLEFQLSTLSFKFTTAAGTIVAGATEYTIQFVLSNGGQNGQFYVAARTGAYASVTTTRSAL